MHDPIPLAPDPRDPGSRPRLPGGVVVRDSPDEVIDAMLADFYLHASSCVRTFGDFQLAISATPAGEQMLRRLMYDLSYRDFPWARTRLWVVDDLFVASQDERRRSRTILETIVSQSDLPSSQFHPMPASDEHVSVVDAANAYAGTLREVLGWREKGHDRLDYVYLPMSRGGSLAGWRGAMCDGSERLVECHEDEGDEPSLSLTMPFLNAARFVAVYAVGEGLASDLARLDHRREPRPTEMPAAHLKPLAGELRWYLDRAACGQAAGV